MSYFGCTCLDGSFIDFIYLSWWIWLDILEGRIHLSLQDLVGGQFWKNKPSLGFHGAWSQQVVCQGPTLHMMMKFLYRPIGHLGGYFPPLYAKWLAWKGQNVTFWGLDVTYGYGLVVMMDTWHILKEEAHGSRKKCLGWILLAFLGLSFPYPTQRLNQKYQTLPKKRVMSCF